MRAAEAHECQHINSTPMHYMKEIREWYGEYMEKEHGIAKSLGTKLGGEFFNIFEDGRIEQIVATHHPGLKVPLQFMNVEMFRDTKLDKKDLDGGQEEYGMLRRLTLCYSKLGVSIPGYKDLAGTELDTYFQKIYPLLDAAVSGLTCADCFSATKQALTILAPYFAKLLKQDSDLAKMLEEMADKMSGGDSESELNDGAPSCGTRMGGGSGEDSPDSKPGGEDGDGDGTPSSPSGRCMDEETTSGPESFGGGKHAIDELDATKLPYSMEELTEAIDKSAAGVAPEADPKSKDVEHNELDEDEKKELRKKYAGDCAASFTENFCSSKPQPLPADTMTRARILHKKLVRILQTKRQEQRNMRKGILDVRALWKVGAGEKGIMMKKGKPVSADCAVFELVDNSGSMAGQKFKLARMVGGALEIALHGLASLKISLFNVLYYAGQTNHITVKDFDEVGPADKSIVYGSITDASITADGGNKDGYSIRVATKELLKRSEKNKVLVIISDGEPTDYNGGTVEGQKDVREAVAEAKKKGIIVIALLIGDVSYIKRFKHRHVEMYGKNLIACEPENMLSEFEKLFTQLIKAS